MKISRTRFFQLLLGGMAAGTALPVLSGCSDDDDGDRRGTGGRSGTGGGGAGNRDGGLGTGGTSGAGGFTTGVSSCATTVEIEENHTHDLTVPAGDVTAMVGMTYTTSLVDGHVHEVTLTDAMMADLLNGDTVTTETSLVDGHRHDVDIVCS